MTSRPAPTIVEQQANFLESSGTMTVVGALALEDRFLIGSDGQIIASNTMTIPAEKLYSSVQMPKVWWGFCGAQPVGFHFRQWFDTKTWGSWDELAAEANGALGQLNGQARAQAAQAGTQTDATEVLLVGYVAGEGRILYLDDTGAFTTVPDPVIFIGAQGLSYLAWDTATRLVPPKSLYTRLTFEAVLDATIDRLPMLGPPSRIIEVLP